MLNCRGRLQKLDSIAERIPDFKPAIPRNRHGIADFNSRLFEAMPPGSQVAHLVGEMGLGQGPHVPCFGADVYLDIAHAEPEAAATLKSERLGRLAQP